ncbi:hypothetical protein ACEPAH_5404 [Sanghuangporus vaninii]
MVRLSLALFALAGFASASASAIHNARSAAHNKMVKVRSASPEPLPAPVEGTAENSTEPISDASDGKDQKRDLQRFTYYKTGLGACGSYSSDSDYIVALNSAQFGNGEHCYKTINVWYNNKQTQATIVDECPGCPEGGLDFSPGLFEFFSDLGTGVLYGTWWFA